MFALIEILDKEHLHELRDTARELIDHSNEDTHKCYQNSQYISVHDFLPSIFWRTKPNIEILLHCENTCDVLVLITDKWTTQETWGW